MEHIHIVGIGGTGMSAIARFLVESGRSVSGSDVQPSQLTDQLQAAGVRIGLRHKAENVVGAEIVVRSSAIPDDNPEILAALEAGIPVLKRAEFMGELMKGKKGIAVSGTHGKTTTTAMICWMLSALGLDPSYLIGGVSLNLKSNAHAGEGEYFVVEADEYDRMFLGLHPDLAIVTNIEHDHPDCFPTESEFFEAFLEFAGNLTEDGELLTCADDPGAVKLAQSTRGNASGYSYGISPHRSIQPDYQGLNLALNAGGCYEYDAFKNEMHLAHVTLAVPGEHNVRNSLAALSAAHLLGLPVEEASVALAEYSGTGRRFEVRGEAYGITVVDDYAHHPSEIRATLAAARQRFPGRSLWAVWQPHTYSRVRELYDAFISAFSEADHVVVTDVYAAREAFDKDFSTGELVRDIDHPDARYVPGLASVSRYLLDHLRRGDVLLVLSAGDAEKISGEILGGLSENGRAPDA